MIVKYSYEIINVDKEAKTMEIVYSSEKYGKLHVGARLPFTNETVEDIVLMYNPSAYWIEQETETLNVEAGTKGFQEIDLNPSENKSASDMIEDVQKSRRLSYAELSDPIFFQLQRGEATEEEWLEAIEQVKEMHPYDLLLGLEAE